VGSPLTEEGIREVSDMVLRALLDAAGPTGSIQVAFRIFPEHVEVDVLHSDQSIQPRTDVLADGTAARRADPVPVGSPRAADSGPAGGDADRGVAIVGERSRATRRSPADPPGQPDRPATFADWMSTALRKEGLTQEAAARMLGVSVKTVSRWVGGATEPRMRDLRRIQEIFGQVPISS